MISTRSAFSDGLIYRIQEDLRSALGSREVNLVGNMYESDFEWENLDLIREQLDSSQIRRAINVGTATALTSAATLGYLIWTIRGSQVLMAAMLASGPNWQTWDPLPVLTFARKAGGKDDVSLAEITEKANKERDDEEEEQQLASSEEAT